MHKRIVVVFIVMYVNVLQAQQVEIRIDGTTATKAYLFELSGERSVLKDSVPAGINGLFKFSLSGSNYHTGFYRLVFEQNKWVDFLNDDKDVFIKTYAKNVQDSLVVVNSESNRKYYSFVKLNKLYKTKSELLQVVLARFPKDDDYYLSTQERLLRLQREYSEFVTSTAQKNLNTFIAQYVASAQLPVIPIATPLDKQLEFLKGHSLDNVNFNNAKLIYSDAFVNKSIEYITYYRNPQLPKELLEKEFMVAVDSLFNKARVNQIVYKHLVDYMITGFKMFGFDKILDYIVENYVIKDDLCLDGMTEALIKKRIDQAKILKIGAIAPNIILPDSAGKKFDLSQISSGKVLLVFYTSSCPHCKEMLPKINELYNQQKSKNVEVVGISLDTKKSDWFFFMKNNSINFLSISDLKGWNSKASSDYFIYATPTMFHLDSNKKIINKPGSMEELQTLFKGIIK